MATLDQFSPDFGAIDEPRVPFSPFAAGTPEQTDPARFSPFPSSPSVDPVAGGLPEPVGLINETVPPSAEAPDLAGSPPAAGGPDVEPVPETPATLPQDTLAADVRSDSKAYQQLGRSRSVMTSQLANLDAQMATTTDPAVQEGLEAKRAELGESLTTITAAQKEAGARAQAGVTEAEENAAIVAADARLKQAETSAVENQVIRADAQRKRDKLATQEQEASSQLEADRDRYRALSARGPKAVAIGSSLAAITSEVFSAALQGRVPDMAKAAAASWKRDREAFSDERQGASSNVKMSGDRVRDLAAQRDAIIAEEAAQKAAVYEAASEQAALQIQRAVTPLEKSRASMVWKGLEELKEQAQRESVLSRMEVLQKQEKHTLDMEYKRAQIGKLGAESQKLGAEAAHAGRRGTGGKRAEAMTTQAQLRGLKPKMARDIEQRGVRGAGGLFLQNPDGSYALAKNAKIASDLDSTHVELQTVNDLLNELHSIRTEYGQEFKQGNSEAHQRMVGAMNQVKLALKNVYELGVLSESDEKILDGITGGDPSGWYDKRPTWLAIRERSEKAFERKLRQKAGYQGKFKLQAPTEYTPPTRKEAVIKYRTHRGGDPAERMEMFKASLSATEGERGSKEEAYSQAHAEANSYIEQEGPKNVDRLQKEFNKASAKKTPEGDAEADRIDDKIEREEKFIFDMKRERTRLRRGVRGVVTQEAAEKKATEDFKKVRGTGVTFAGKI